MNLASLESIVREFNTAGVRYLIAGGLAVGAHGYPRFTMDVDLVVELGVDNIVAAFHALAGLGYRPLVPITAEAFSDKAQRERWTKEKGMQVLNFFSDQHKATSVDVFVTESSASTRNTTVRSRRASRLGCPCVSFQSRR